MGSSKSERKRVLYVNQFFSHYRSSVIDEFLHKSNHDFVFMGADHSFGSGIALADNIPPEKFKRSQGYRFWKFLFWPRPVFAALNPRYDALVLLGNSTVGAMWLAAIFGRLTGKEVYFWTHGWVRKDTGIKRFIRNTFYGLANGLLLYGHRSKMIGIGEGFDPDRLHVVYNALDCESQDNTRAKISSDDRDKTRNDLFGEHASNPTIINITRLHHYKKLDMLIDAAAILKDRGHPVNILIVGDGPHKSELEQLADDKEVSAVFTGALYDELEIGQMLNASDVAVMPGPVGLLVMHALAYGVPVITNDHFDRQMPEFEAIVPGVTGGFFEKDNVEALADCIQTFFADSSSHNERYARSREIIERFYNPTSQRRLIDRALSGEKADDLANAVICQIKD